MAKIKELFARERRQYLIFLGVSFVAAISTGILYFSKFQSFQLYFGKINPILTVITIVITGLILLTFLLSKSWFVIYRSGIWKERLYTLILAFLLALIIIGVDIRVVLPKDMNILFPESLLFYPAIGLVVEILFHLFPLTLLLVILPVLFKKVSFEIILWFSLIAVSLLEPTYQTIAGPSGQYPLWSVIYIWIHIFLINIFQLIIFKHYDFVTMYSFRLAYYLLWHIVWGKMRLDFLF